MKKPSHLLPLLVIVLGTLSLTVVLFNLRQRLLLPNQAAGGTVDTLSYLIGNHAIGQSSDPKALSGLTNIVTKSYQYYVKSSNGVAYEYRTWHNNYIYLRQDTSIGPTNSPARFSTATSYNLDPGIWMKRQMAVGESITTISKLTYFKNCQPMEAPGDFHYTMTLEQVTTYDAGGDIGKQNVIVLKYDYVSGFERFYYSRDWGFIRWEEWNGSTHTMNRFVNFNKIMNPVANPKPACGSPTPPPIRKVTPTPKITPTPSPTSSISPTPQVTATPTVTPTPTVTVSPTPISSATCQGNAGSSATCFDCNGDGVINILDFSCFAKFYNQNVNQ